MHKHNVNVGEPEDNDVADNKVNEDALSENNIEDKNADSKSDANTTVGNHSQDPKPYKCDLCNFASEKAYCDPPWEHEDIPGHLSSRLHHAARLRTQYTCSQHHDTYTPGVAGATTRW